MQNTKADPWKKLGAWLLIGVGAVIAMTAWSGTAGPTVLLADFVFWPLDGAQNLTPESQLLAAVLGGVMIGWGAMVLLLVARIYPHDPALARSIILPAIWVWFTIDSLASIIAGAPMNVVLNLGFLLAFIVPWRNAQNTDLRRSPMGSPDNRVEKRRRTET